MPLYSRKRYFPCSHAQDPPLDFSACFQSLASSPPNASSSAVFSSYCNCSSIVLTCRGRRLGFPSVFDALAALMRRCKLKAIGAATSRTCAYTYLQSMETLPVSLQTQPLEILRKNIAFPSCSVMIVRNSKMGMVSLIEVFVPSLVKAYRTYHSNISRIRRSR